MYAELNTAEDRQQAAAPDQLPDSRTILTSRITYGSATLNLSSCPIWARWIAMRKLEESQVPVDLYGL